jgi:hypothetical protein
MGVLGSQGGQVSGDVDGFDGRLAEELSNCSGVAAGAEGNLLRSGIFKVCPIIKSDWGRDYCG